MEKRVTSADEVDEAVQQSEGKPITLLIPSAAVKMAEIKAVIVKPVLR